MMVKVHDEVYALPLANILEIVKPGDAQLATINDRPVMRLRDEVLPLIDLAAMFGHTENPDRRPYAVVIGMGPDRAGLLVHRLVGQEEVVIKPLDDMFDQTNLVSGATVREDGGVSLIVDIGAMLKACGEMNS
jgi:two-component system chemotaxis sensor kinase CheA